VRVTCTWNSGLALLSAGASEARSASSTRAKLSARPALDTARRSAISARAATCTVCPLWQAQRHIECLYYHNAKMTPPGHRTNPLPRECAARGLRREAGAE
jgi:hypothetical protein